MSAGMKRFIGVMVVLIAMVAVCCSSGTSFANWFDKSSDSSATNANSSTAGSQSSSGPWVKPAQASAPWVKAPGREKLAPAEREFLTKLGQSVKNDEISGKLNAITEKLSVSPTLDKDDYIYLVNLAQRINNKKINGLLAQIAQKHKP